MVTEQSGQAEEEARRFAEQEAGVSPYTGPIDVAWAGPGEPSPGPAATVEVSGEARARDVGVYALFQSAVHLGRYQAAVWLLETGYVGGVSEEEARLAHEVILVGAKDFYPSRPFGAGTVVSRIAPGPGDDPDDVEAALARERAREGASRRPAAGYSVEQPDGGTVVLRDARLVAEEAGG